MNLLLEGTVALSEESEKVLKAIENLIGDASHTVEQTRESIRVASEDPACLNVIHDQLRDRHVRAAARRLLQSNLRGDTTTVLFNRQAAFTGVAAMCSNEEESPLGPIYVTIRSEKLTSLIEWLTAYEGG